jgi:predicted nucleic acid-binding protein
VSRRVVCDASALTALLIDGGPDGQWAAAVVADAELIAPSLVDFETSNIMRRHEAADLISADQAVQAHADLLDLAIERWPYELLATRAWELRLNLSIYDASYVALAELLDVELVTLDRRIARAPGPRCTISTPESDRQ